MKSWIFMSWVVIVALSGPLSPPAFADPSLLWSIVTLKCLRHLAKAEAPIPCDYVDDSQGDERGYAMLKDKVGGGQMLLIPTQRMTGIEDPRLLAPDARNYFAAAWESRPLVEFHLRRRLGRDAVAIVVDSKTARFDDQLHFRIDCVDRDAASILRDRAEGFDAHWRQMPVEMKGRRYWARRVDSPDLKDVSPFRLLADELDGARTELSRWSLAAAPVEFGERPGFVLLADDGPEGAADLLDHGCAIAEAGLSGSLR